MSAAAQGFTVQGRVRKAELKAALQGATVTLQEQRDTTNMQTTFTNSAGHYQFTAVAIVVACGFEKVYDNEL